MCGLMEEKEGRVGSVEKGSLSSGGEGWLIQEDEALARFLQLRGSVFPKWVI